MGVKMEKKRPGPKPDLVFQSRIGFPGRTKAQIAQALAGERIDYKGKVFVDFNVGLEIGSIIPCGPHKIYDRFKTQVEAMIWWTQNKTEYMNRIRVEYMAGERCAVDRPSIFWELSFGLFGYLGEADEFFLLDSHSLWFDEKERDLTIVYLMENSIPIPEVKFRGCLLHPCGDPIKWPDEPSVKLEGGIWKRADCKSTKMIYEKKLESKNLIRR